MALLVGVATAGGMYGGNWCVRREIRNHDAAFNQMMWELWENPDRNRSVMADQDPRIIELQDYLASGFLHIITNDPPFGALERFDGVSLEEYNTKCLGIAKAKLDQLSERT